MLVKATDAFDWKSAWKKNSTRQTIGVGLACGIEKGSYVATCARIAVNDNGTYTVSLRPAQVYDVDGLSATDVVLGTFDVNLK